MTAVHQVVVAAVLALARAAELSAEDMAVIERDLRLYIANAEAAP